MKIETKFDIGEFAYMIYDNKVKNVVVTNISVEVERKATTRYAVRVFYGSCKIVDEKDLFKTKKAAVREMVRLAGYKISKDDLKEITIFKQH